VTDNDTKKYFDTVANQWDEMRRTFFGDGVRDLVIRAAEISKDAVVADVGTGTGFLAEGALAAGACVIGIDSSPIWFCTTRQTRNMRSGRWHEGSKPEEDWLSPMPILTLMNGYAQNSMTDGLDLNAAISHGCSIMLVWSMSPSSIHLKSARRQRNAVRRPR
jgi:SAM-dependent methyltransferase